MGELSILSRLTKVRDIKPKTMEELAPKATEGAGKAAVKPALDINKAYQVKTKEGIVVPFNPGTPVEKAKQWTKNYLSPKEHFDDRELSASEQVRKLTFKPPADNIYGAGSILYEKEAKGYRIRATELDQKYKGQGFGAALYRQLFEKAKREGVPVRSDSTVSPEAQAVWRRLKQLGYPVIERQKTTADSSMFEYDPKVKQ